jgi:hypothetical protein
MQARSHGKDSVTSTAISGTSSVRKKDCATRSFTRHFTEVMISSHVQVSPNALVRGDVPPDSNSNSQCFLGDAQYSRRSNIPPARDERQERRFSRFVLAL